MTTKKETWSRGTNSSLPFDVHVMLNLSINETVCRAHSKANLLIEDPVVLLNI